jgi:hypothetical protein
MKFTNCWNPRALSIWAQICKNKFDESLSFVVHTRFFLLADYDTLMKNQ